MVSLVNKCAKTFLCDLRIRRVHTLKHSLRLSQVHFEMAAIA